jgi:hypothetical protein
MYNGDTKSLAGRLQLRIRCYSGNGAADASAAVSEPKVSSFSTSSAGRLSREKLHEGGARKTTCKLAQADVMGLIIQHGATG